MPRIPLMLLITVMAALCAPSPASARERTALDPAACLRCHGDKIADAAFAASVHGRNGCTSCHVEITEPERHPAGGIRIGKVRCVRCHKKETADHYAGVHMLNEVSCTACHGSIHELRAWNRDKRKVVETCRQCHDREAADYLRSIHGRSLTGGNQDSPACNDCHGLHRIRPLGDPESSSHKRFHSQVCMTCHGNAGMMKRNGVFTLSVQTYENSYHGKNFRLGYPERVAGCADCHTSHLVLPPADPASSVSPGKIVTTCRKCHRNATASFAGFHAHGDPSNRRKYPVLYWTYVSMTGLLAGVFAVFWVHSLLWMFRGFVENRRKQAEPPEQGGGAAAADGRRLYRRFTPLQIFLHFLVITSFLGLALTGLPLRFSDQGWAGTMMDFYGGTAHAGLIHRICALVTFSYFLAFLVMSFRFLFIRTDVPGNWLQRLLGPDSLFPNLRDIRDVTGMARWFLFRGPKPTFERWTYWEKFDFFAVFWGMFAIGGSGLILWFPEFFGGFLPGWMFNVATIIHSDEALLATGFIFTVHFFNTHGRPEKFPMDFVIFNGQISRRELCEERLDQWRRYREEGSAERFAVERPSGVVYDFLFKGFGFLALLTGLILLFLMILGFLTGSGR